MSKWTGSSNKKSTSASSAPSATPGVRPAPKVTPATVAKPQQFKAPPPASLAAHRTWTATVKTTCGTMTFLLDGQKAPQTVSSFIFLARKGFFDNTTCHRLTTSGLYVLQCGDPTGTGNGGPGYGFGIENAPKAGNYPAGTIAMARTSDPKSNGSQFFIVYQDSTLPTTGGGYSIFGTVTSGSEVVLDVAVGRGQPAGRRRPQHPDQHHLGEREVGGCHDG